MGWSVPWHDRQFCWRMGATSREKINSEDDEVAQINDPDVRANGRPQLRVHNRHRALRLPEGLFMG
jgi:hypothetical protein